MATSLSVWTDELTVRLPGASTDQIDLELKATVREFFTKSGFWTEELDPIDIVADTDIYTLTPTEGVIMGTMYVWVDHKSIPLSTIKPKTVSTSSNSVQTAWAPQPNQIQLFPMPSVDITGGLKVLVRLNPDAKWRQLPDELGSHFFDEILDGVLGRLYSQPGKPYTNIVVSQYHLRRFRDGIARARDMGQKRYSNAETPWTYPFFA